MTLHTWVYRGQRRFAACGKDGLTILTAKAYNVLLQAQQSENQE